MRCSHAISIKALGVEQRENGENRATAGKRMKPAADLPLPKGNAVSFKGSWSYPSPHLASETMILFSWATGKLRQYSLSFWFPFNTVCSRLHFTQRLLTDAMSRFPKRTNSAIRHSFQKVEERGFGYGEFGCRHKEYSKCVLWRGWEHYGHTAQRQCK